MPHAPLLALLFTLFAAPLSDARREQLASATDRSPLMEESALYALLADAAERPEGVETGATVPDYAALREAPAAHRGELFLIEGQFARARRIPLSRPGPWGEAVTEWAILVNDQPGHAADEVAVVWFADPQDTLPDPRPGQRVRTAARFYKVWGDTDLQGNPVTYVTFVGRGARVLAPPPGESGGASPVWVIVPVLVLLFIGLVFLRRAGRSRPLRVSRHRTAAPSDAGADDACSDGEPALPEDPAEALAELERRRESS